MHFVLQIAVLAHRQRIAGAASGPAPPRAQVSARLAEPAERSCVASNLATQAKPADRLFRTAG